MNYPYPINIDLSRKQVAVIGGGKIAARKVAGLLDAKANVFVISPSLCDKIDPAKITWIKKDYATGDIADMDLIIACTNSRRVNRQVTKDATHFQLVNDASDKKQSDFFNVARVESKNLLVTVSTKGKSPTKAKQIKKEIRQWLETRHWFNQEEG
ncbi:precorrin-2 dehydrogenase/sirohydrochlorin ferrochelatase family protein [Secundilactobacillus paracollinoides]|uniref:precorrin-2 dehydrogenase/sirohydrochlorin ferrochelatase family protein n=1 Tax=Secundilactobacillus paracollinoides TaxID=240427 RepID=UPI0006D21A22|nr:bifunctional precorrin-2 dehydrogenase/sirohydrochlorin ferrochelatase [Secundilactobacillus paracollinoides]